ncbi:MAG: hypothetical protein U1F26_16965 [Lysobacterales bacterium]
MRHLLMVLFLSISVSAFAQSCNQLNLVGIQSVERARGARDLVGEFNGPGGESRLTVYDAGKGASVRIDLEGGETFDIQRGVGGLFVRSKNMANDVALEVPDDLQSTVTALIGDVQAGATDIGPLKDLLSHIPPDETGQEVGTFEIVSQQTQSLNCAISAASSILENAPEAQACLNAATGHVATSAGVGATCTLCGIAAVSVYFTWGISGWSAVTACTSCVLAAGGNYMTGNNMELACAAFIEHEQEEN